MFGLVFFSLSVNKLPGYVLPLLPALSVLAGLRLADSRRAGALLAISAALIGLLPVIAAILPRALARGITHVEVPATAWLGALPALVLAAAVWIIDRRGRRVLAAGVTVAGMVASVAWLKLALYPVLDRTVSAHVFWSEIQGRATHVCVASANRGWRYNLNYYSGTPLPDCSEDPRPLQIHQDADHGASLETEARP
jgi:4-amino-4-deoxy-L-arabinose transferase-like glycosyltransferase